MILDSLFKLISQAQLVDIISRYYSHHCYSICISPVVIATALNPAEKPIVKYGRERKDPIAFPVALSFLYDSFCLTVPQHPVVKKLSIEQM